MKDIKLIKAFLLRHNHTESEIEHLEKEELIKLYEEDVRKDTLNYLHYTNKDSYVITSPFDEVDISEFKAKVRENLTNTLLLIETIKESFDNFSYAEIADILTLSVQDISAHKLQRILRIAYREFQETLLDRIAKQLKDLPVEEYKVMMSHYEKIRNDTERLQNTIAELSNEKKREQILKMAHLKLHIIKDFMPTDIFNDSYKEYLNNTPEKLKLVSEILSLTGIYSKSQLKNMPQEELEAMKEKIIEDKKQDEKDQKIYKQYTQMLDESMYGVDDKEFSDVCTKIITNLNERQILMITEYLDAKNPIFLNRFHSLYRDFRKNAKR
ncbi:hypothetical protein [Helicobacter marmotae]|uniref:Uncharacterized protein n=1 Tax=Helicobacter marmotae TaxID=152490 RepID=A0A3D8I2C1_9HELI|nr:hypothetical protein [Helicobacter marmotae]RDU59279.1 hypothetical protein CQA63_07480 [Helicobacter marmotae]